MNWAFRMKERGEIFLMVGVGWVVGAAGCREVMSVMGLLSAIREIVSWGGVMAVDIEYRDSITFRSRWSYTYVYVCSLFVGRGRLYSQPSKSAHAAILVSEILPMHWQYYLELSYGIHGVRTADYPELAA